MCGKSCPPRDGLPAHGITEPRQVHSGQHQAVDPAEVFVQRRCDLGTTRQVDVAISNIRRRSAEHPVTLHLLQFCYRHDLVDDPIRHGSHSLLARIRRHAQMRGSAWGRYRLVSTTRSPQLKHQPQWHSVWISHRAHPVGGSRANMPSPSLRRYERTGVKATPHRRPALPRSRAASPPKDQARRARGDEFSHSRSAPPPLSICAGHGIARLPRSVAAFAPSKWPAWRALW